MYDLRSRYVICEVCKTEMNFGNERPPEFLIRAGLSSFRMRLAAIMWRNRGRIVPRGTIVNWLWLGARLPETLDNNLNVHMCRIRTVFAANGYALTNVYGVGYRLSAIVDKE